MNHEQGKAFVLKGELSFASVMARLKLALGLDTDTQLCAALGVSTSSFANRKRAGSIPYDAVLPLALSRNVSLDWLFGGSGSTFVDGKTGAHAAPRATIDILLMGRVMHAVALAVTAAQQVDGDRAAGQEHRLAAKMATQLANMAGVIYNDVVFTDGDAQRQAKIQDAAKLFASLLALDRNESSAKPVDRPSEPG